MILPVVPLLTPPPMGGWTRSQLIELADRRTERRGSKTLDLNSEFLLALQYLCMERRWSWRRKTSFFQINSGQWQYDLTLAPSDPTAVLYAASTFEDHDEPEEIRATFNVVSTTDFLIGQQVAITNVTSFSGTPGAFFNGIRQIVDIDRQVGTITVLMMSPGIELGPVTYNGLGGTMVNSSALNAPNCKDLHQFVKHGVKFYPHPGNPRAWSELTPMFERDLQMAVIHENTYFPAPKPPRQYFLMPGAFLVLCIAPMPDRSYPISLDYWAYPNLAWDSVSEQIPIIPAFMHQVLLKRLEAQIFRYTLGEGAAKYQAAMAEYSALVANYAGMDNMVPGEHIDYSADDDYESNFHNAQNAVQSTR